MADKSAHTSLSTNACIVLALLCDQHRYTPQVSLRKLEPKGWQEFGDLVADLGETISPAELRGALKELDARQYVEVLRLPSRAKDRRNRLTIAGVHFALANHAAIMRKLQRSRKTPPTLLQWFSELGSSLGLATQDEAIPASDRFVRVVDNRPAFDAVLRSLDAVKSEFARDHNKNLIPQELKAQANAEIAGFLVQIKNGLVSKEAARSLLTTLTNIEKVAMRVAAAAAAIGFAIAAIRKATGL
jgi:hypothetical protein